MKASLLGHKVAFLDRISTTLERAVTHLDLAQLAGQRPANTQGRSQFDDPTNLLVPVGSATPKIIQVEAKIF